MTDDWLLSLIYAAWLTASTMPLGFMLGSSCSPCCGCGVADGKPRTDPKDEGTWVPSGTWATSVTWTFTANPGDESGETWFFYGSASTSKPGGGASTAEREDWGNLCNWYSNKLTAPSSRSSLSFNLNKRATRLPPPEAVVHFYSTVNTYSVGPQTIKNAYFWGPSGFANFLVGDSATQTPSELTTTNAAHDTTKGSVFNGAAGFTNSIVSGGVLLNGSSQGELATVNGGAFLSGTSLLRSVTVNGGAIFNDTSSNFVGFAQVPADSPINGGATFNNASVNSITAIINGGATFNDTTTNRGEVNGGATYNDNAVHGNQGLVNGGAVFNDAACSQYIIGTLTPAPCTRKFVAHPTDLPTCNGTAKDGCFTPTVFCGCG